MTTTDPRNPTSRRVRIVQADAARIADLLDRISTKLRKGDLVDFVGKAGARAANGYPNRGDTTRGGATSTATERAALTNLTSPALRAWTGLLEAARMLYAFEHELEVALNQAERTGRENTVEVCADCCEPITGAIGDKPKRLDGQPFHNTAEQPCWWRAYNATRGRRGA